MADSAGQRATAGSMAVPRHGIDDRTLARARRGDRAALGAVVRRFQDPVYALVARMLSQQPARVDDVAQDVLLKVIRAIDRFDPQGSARLSTWILTIATRTCLDVLRRPLPRGPDSGTLVSIGPGSDPARTAEQRELGRRVEQAIAQLPAPQRAVLVLRAYHDLDYAEIARILGVAPGTVKSRLGRARQALRPVLAGEAP